ncbi:MAG: alpha/beta fold hydrolase, partial [Chloroflexota bacterium]
MDIVATAPDGLTIHATTDGAGTPALVFVHGWSCDRSHWDHQVRSFAGRHQVVAIDLGGHGTSGSARAIWSIAAFRSDVVAVVEHLELDDVVLIGHSMGGDVVVDAALVLGDRVRGLVWVDVYATLGSPRDPAVIEAFLAPFEADFPTATERFVRGFFPPSADPALVDRVARGMAERPPAIALDAMRHSISNDGPILDQLRALRRRGTPLVSIDPLPDVDADSLARF